LLNGAAASSFAVMRRALLLLCCFHFFFQTAAIQAAPLPSIFGLESLGWSPQGFDGTLIVIQADEQRLFVSFEGRSSPLPASEPHAMNITRGKSVSQPAWDAFLHRFQVRQGKPTTVTFSNGSYMSRSGVYLLDFPEDKFEIYPDEAPDLSPSPRGSRYFAFENRILKSPNARLAEATGWRSENTLTRLTPGHVP
jgi:hypothetical protein